MRVFVRGIAVALVVSALYGTLQTAHAALTVIQATPKRGHFGDPIDLSGTGFPANTQLAVLMACPNLQRAKRNYALQYGPWTDGQGNFAGFMVSAIQTHGLPLPTGCVIYMSPINKQLADDIPAVYYLEPRSVRLSGCEARMCVRIQARPRRIRAGYREQLSVTGWPGARTEVTIAYPGGVPTTSIHHLNWRGTFSMQIPVSGTYRGLVHVRVRTLLMRRMTSGSAVPISASSQATFTVLH
ncbi:MAG TPA: hypothetical protein VFB58_14605 [Chloroflexota bacterium]|nr:hypothetical protein [Chloroflexota bacterium]